MQEVVGIEQRTSKKSNNTYFMLHLVQPFTGDTAVGMRTSQEYVRAELMPSGLSLGDKVNLAYERGFEGRAYLSGVYLAEKSVEDKAKNK